VSFTECEQACQNNAECRAFEYGTFPARCTSEDLCKCWLVTGLCSHPHAHSGYNVNFIDRLWQ
jgi:hypothetical protein